MTNAPSVTSKTLSIDRPHVVIIGAGFGGLRAAQQLNDPRLRVTVIDRANHHLFWPLLYQVATGGMSAEEIAVPVRSVLRKQRNTEVVLAEVTSVDLQQRQVHLHDGVTLQYDHLIVAAGATSNFYGNSQWRQTTHTLTSLEEAYGIRAQVLGAFEEAERCRDEVRRRQLLTFVAVGGGPTGVELAGALCELSHAIVKADFRHVSPKDVRILLVEMMPQLLAPFGEKLSEKARDDLTQMGVEVRTHAKVEDIQRDSIRIDGETVPCNLVCWTAGVKPRPLAGQLGIPLDERGFVRVEQHCAIVGAQGAYAIGDMAAFVPQGQTRQLPGLAPVAMQQGACVARNILRQLDNKPARPFVYRDKGIMATIGSGRAVVKAGKISLHGFFAWLAWIFVHVFFLIGFRSRSLVLFEWFWAYTTHRRGARVISEVTSASDASGVRHRPEDSNEAQIAAESGARSAARREPDRQITPL